MSIFIRSFLSILVVSIFLNLFIIGNTLAKNDYQLDVFAKKSGYSTAGVKASLPTAVQLVINVVLSLVGIFFLVLTVYAGVRWMTAQGNSEAVTKAQETLQAAIIGLVVVSMSYAISTLIFNTLASNIPADSGESSVVAATCNADSDCKAGEKCTPLGKCFNANCSDMVFQCGGACNVKCGLGQICNILSDCTSGNCEGNLCVAMPVCSNFKTVETCPTACDWTFPTEESIEMACVVK